MTSFALDYLIFVFLSALGVLLMVTGYGRLNGLMLVGRRLSMLAGVLLVAGTFTWFFISKPRNLPDTGAGLDGNEQALLFVTGAGAALVLILALSSLRNWSMTGEPDQQGIEALRNASYLRLLFKEVRGRWDHWYGQTKERSSG